MPDSPYVMSHGAHWSAVHPDVERIVELLLPRAAQEGKLLGCAPYDGGREVCALAYEPGKAVQALVLVEGRAHDPGGKMDLLTFYPFLAGGISHRVRIAAIRERENEWEAVIEGTIGEVEMSVGFFDPLYPLNRDRYRVGEEHEFVLAALAYSAHPPKQTEFTIRKGPMFERERQRMLEDDPTLDPASVTEITISLEGMRAYLPREQFPDDAEFRSVVEDTVRCTLDMHSFDRLRVTVAVPSDSSPITLPLYASWTVLEDFRPEPDTEIEGICWVQGYLRDGAGVSAALAPSSADGLG